MKEHIREQAEAYKIEQEMNVAARKDMMNDYRKFLDHQKWGNQVLKERMGDMDNRHQAQ